MIHSPELAFDKVASLFYDNKKETCQRYHIQIVLWEGIGKSEGRILCDDNGCELSACR
jgi:hypothetical protein